MTSPSPNKALYISLACALIPLIAGVSIFVLWLNTRWDWLETAGVWTIMGGVALAVVGVIALGRGWRVAREGSASGRRCSTRGAVLCAALLLLNFPVAIGIVMAVDRIESCYVVVMHNSSAGTVRNLRALGGGCDESFGSLASGASATRGFWIQSEGVLEFEAEGASGIYKESFGYATPGLGGRVTVTLGDEGAIDVRHESH